MAGSRLTFEQRATLQRCWAAGFLQKDAAVAVGVSPSTISRELARNGDDRYGSAHPLRRQAGRLRREYAPRYAADLAQQRADRRAARPKEAKLATPGPLRDTVMAGLRLRWSPEQIAGRLRYEHPDAPERHVSAETIYLAYYLEARGGLKKLLEDENVLRSGRRNRRPATTPDGRRARFASLPSIHQRPTEADDRTVPGHFEGDLIVGANNRSAMATIVERTSRMLLLIGLQHRTSEHVTQQITAQMITLPAQIRRTLTWDNGAEMVGNHAEFTIATDCEVYFADPHSPWQRGTNENTNGLLRQYFPKGTDLSSHTQQHLDEVAAELNGRPRRVLGYKTPAEVFNELLLATTP